MHGHPMSIAQASPGSTSSQVITPHWQQQLLKCDVRISSFSLLVLLSFYVVNILGKTIVLTELKDNGLLSVPPLDDSGIAVTPPPRSGECNGIADGHQVSHHHHQSQQTSTLRAQYKG